MSLVPWTGRRQRSRLQLKNACFLKTLLYKNIDKMSVALGNRLGIKEVRGGCFFFT